MAQRRDGAAQPGRWRPALAMVALGVALQIAVLQALGLFGGGSPSLTAPTPMPLALLALHFLPAVALPTLAFWLWTVPLFSGATEFPRRSVVLLVVGGALSVLWFAAAAWQRLGVGWPLPLLSVGLFLVAAALAGSCRLRPSFWKNALAHWLLFAWLGSYAFAWLGEVP